MSVKTFSPRTVPSGAAFDDERLDDDAKYAIRNGESVLATWPTDGVSLRMRPPKASTKLNPVMRCGPAFIVVDPDLARELASEPFVECLPVRLLDHAGVEVSREHVLLNVLKVACLDAAETVGERNVFDGTFDSISSFAFDLDALGTANIFRIQSYNPSVTFVRGALAERLESLPSAYVAELDELDE